MLCFNSYIAAVRTIKHDIPATSVELEAKVLIDKRKKMPYYIKPPDDPIDAVKKIAKNISKCSHQVIVSQTANFINTKPDKMYIKQLHFVNGVQDKLRKTFTIKSKLAPAVFLVSKTAFPYKLSLSAETDETDIENRKTSVNYDIYDIVRFKLRYSITISDCPNWRIDITLVKECKSKAISYLKECRDSLFAKHLTNDINQLDDMYGIADFVELEFEFVGDLNHFTVSDLDIIDTYINVNNYKTQTQQCIYTTAKLIEHTKLAEFHDKYGLKQLGNNPIELTKPLYIKHIHTTLTNYYITDKVDGERCLVFIESDKQVAQIIKKTYSELTIASKYKTTIFDAECVANDNETNIYIFDVIYYDGVAVFKLPFSERLTYMDKIANIDSRFKTKPFTRINDVHHLSSLFNDGNKVTNVNADNHIDTTETQPYETDGHVLVLSDASYMKTRSYKWKPIDKMTIDFVAKRCPKRLCGVSPYDSKEGHVLYILFTGIRKSEYVKNKITTIRNYNDMFQVKNDTYVPIQFSPSLYPNAYLFWSKDDTLDGKVVELSYNKEWKLVKVRDDRTIDVDNKLYYGNNFKIAEQIWMNYANPLTKYNVVNIGDQYFQNIDDTYAALRKFNNFVKNTIMNDYKTSHVVDLACGKGQDLFKYINDGCTDLVMIDNDIDALTEVVSRKHTFLESNKYTKPTSIFIKKINLCDNSVNIISQIRKNTQLPESGVPLVVCNFAIHYLIGNRDAMKNICTVLDNIMASGGVFIFTAFNGRKIFNLEYNNSNVWDVYENDKLKYSIKKKYISNTFTGVNQKIDVLHPFSNGQRYTENIINDKMFIQECKKKKINLIQSGGFGDWIDLFKQKMPDFAKNISTIDINYASLYSYYIFKKK
jgi:hypothetical protein